MVCFVSPAKAARWLNGTWSIGALDPPAGMYGGGGGLPAWLEGVYGGGGGRVGGIRSLNFWGEMEAKQKSHFQELWRVYHSRGKKHLKHERLSNAPQRRIVANKNKDTEN